MNKKVTIPIILIAMLLLVAYRWISSVSANPLSNLERTQQAATATAFIPSLTPTLTPSLAPAITQTPLPSPTATETQPPTQTPNPSSAQGDNPVLSQSPTPVLSPTPVTQFCDLVGFLGDGTIPDGSIFNPGDSFTKVWQLRNMGTCSWTTGFSLVFVNGDLMGGPVTIPLPAVVNPGDTLNLSVNLTAPLTSGIYQGDWMLRDVNGIIFGTGVNADQAFWVNIVVNGSPTFAVTSVTETANPASYTGDCPVSIALDANITSSSAGTVTYYWQRSDGSRSPLGTLIFTAAGSQIVEDGWNVAVPGTSITGWDQIYIDQPNHQLFDPVTFSVICNPPTPTPPPPAATPTLPAPTATPTLPPPAATPTLPAPTATPTLPAPTATPTLPAPTATPTLPAPTATPTQVGNGGS